MGLGRKFWYITVMFQLIVCYYCCYVVDELKLWKYGKLCLKISICKQNMTSCLVQFLKSGMKCCRQNYIWIKFYGGLFILNHFIVIFFCFFNWNLFFFYWFLLYYFSQNTHQYYNQIILYTSNSNVKTANKTQSTGFSSNPMKKN